MIRTQIEIEDQQMQWLKTVSQETGVAVSQIIRDSISLFREHEERSRLRKKASASARNFASGISDISERHDDYLAEAYKTGKYE